MARGEKFDRLRDHFHSYGSPTLTLSFQEIETILGMPLSPSAYQYTAYWSPSATHTFPEAWINEGYLLTQLDLNLQIATWERKEEGPFHPAASPIIRSLPSERHKSSDLLSADVAIQKVQAYYQEIQSVENGRYKSWEHCYAYFHKFRNRPLSEEQIDLLCLHLAFYLASWGMYRGSSFLLQRDYRIHHDIVTEIFADQYAPLWGASSESLMDVRTLDLLFDLVRRVEALYVEKRASIDGRTSVSETLLTKVLLGTLGCVPAYDRYFVAAVRMHKITSGQFNKTSVANLAGFYHENRNAFEALTMKVEGLSYPPMKLIDMCFWQIGYESENTRLPLEDEAL